MMRLGFYVLLRNENPAATVDSADVCPAGACWATLLRYRFPVFMLTSLPARWSRDARRSLKSARRAWLLVACCRLAAIARERLARQLGAAVPAGTSSTRVEGLWAIPEVAGAVVVRASSGPRTRGLAPYLESDSPGRTIGWSQSPIASGSFFAGRGHGLASRVSLNAAWPPPWTTVSS